MYPIIHIGPYAFYSFGMIVGLGIAISSIAFRAYFKRRGLDIHVPTLCTIVMITGFIGAKLDHLLFNQRDGLSGLHWLSQASLADMAQGGFTYFGGMIAATAAASIFIWVRRLPFLETFDSLFCIGLAYGIGRIGCFTSGDGDYGTPTTLPWAISFPHGIIPTADRVHPTMLYLSAWELAIFAILWRVSNARRQPPLRPGTLLGCYLVASGAGRFLVEILSRNPVIAWGLKEPQLVSLAMIAVGLILLGRILLTLRSAASPAQISLRQESPSI